MKMLSVWQPWASFLALGLKVHETRSWMTHYRGPLVIHAAGRWSEAQAAEWRRIRGEEPFPPLGAIVAVGRLVICKPTVVVARPHCRLITTHEDSLDLDLGDWTVGRWAWEIREIVALTHPLPFRGQQGLADLDPTTIHEVGRRVLETMDWTL